MKYSGFELTLLSFQILLDSNLHKYMVYLLFGQNECGSEEIAVVIKEWYDGFKLMVWPELWIKVL